MRVLACRDDGKLTYCSCPPESRGKGRCKHVAHMDSMPWYRSLYDNGDNYATNDNDGVINAYTRPRKRIPKSWVQRFSDECERVLQDVKCVDISKSYDGRFTPTDVHMMRRYVGCSVTISSIRDELLRRNPDRWFGTRKSMVRDRDAEQRLYEQYASQVDMFDFRISQWKADHPEAYDVSNRMMSMDYRVLLDREDMDAIDRTMSELTEDQLYALKVRCSSEMDALSDTFKSDRSGKWTVKTRRLKRDEPTREAYERYRSQAIAEFGLQEYMSEFESICKVESVQRVWKRKPKYDEGVTLPSDLFFL